MKRILTLLLCLAMVSCIAFPAFAAANENVETRASVYWYINADNVTFRLTANGAPYGQVNKGDLFDNLGLEGPTNQLYWRHCHMTSGQNAGKYGYVADNYCSSKLAVE